MEISRENLPGALKRKLFILFHELVRADVSRGDSKEKAIMGAAAPKPPLAIPPHSKLWGTLAFSREMKAKTYLFWSLNYV